MATNALILSIPNPCSENWNNMIPQEKGRFCDTCQKCVVDFTAMTDAAVLDYFNKNNGKVCGRFDKQQLDRVLIINDKLFKKRFNIAASLLLLSSLGFGNTVKHESIMPIKTQSFFVNSKVSKSQFKTSNELFFENRIKVNGNIFNDENPKEPLVGASIFLKGTSIGAVTGTEGDFDFTIPKESLKDGILVVTYVGFENQEIELSKLTKTESLTFELKSLTLGEVIVVGGVSYYKPNLWKRFTNLFRRKKS
jgi:CarboxypepD_reg-like domain